MANPIDEHKRFQPYVTDLEELLNDIISQSGKQLDPKSISLFLDGYSDSAIRQLIPLDIRRRYGIFSTGEEYKTDLSRLLDAIISEESSILDPACGTGNLLLLASDHLPTMDSLTETCKLWGTRLLGYDIYPEFVLATKLRLILKAINRGVVVDDVRLLDLIDYFSNIELLDFLVTTRPISKYTHILLNPPYNTTRDYGHPSWSTGSVSSAALFIDKCIELADENTHIVAVLPDVLRSGSRYGRWRRVVNSTSLVRRIITRTRFDKWTDVHVFILHLVVKKNEIIDESVWLDFDNSSNKKLGDYFDVHVGPVVPHRDQEEGLVCSFATCKDIRPWKTLSHLPAKRKYSGTLYDPPFVVLRRTSRPGQRNRLSPAIINTRKSVAVENHLLVVTPKSKTLKACMRLVYFLAQEQVTDWVDKRIRCRHLTVQSIKEIPVDGNEFK